MKQNEEKMWKILNKYNQLIEISFLISAVYHVLGSPSQQTGRC